MHESTAQFIFSNKQFYNGIEDRLIFKITKKQSTYTKKEKQIVEYDKPKIYRRSDMSRNQIIKFNLIKYKQLTS